MWVSIAKITKLLSIKCRNASSNITQAVSQFLRLQHLNHCTKSKKAVTWFSESTQLNIQGYPPLFLQPQPPSYQDLVPISPHLTAMRMHPIRINHTHRDL